MEFVTDLTGVFGRVLSVVVVPNTLIRFDRVLAENIPPVYFSALSDIPLEIYTLLSASDRRKPQP